MSVELSGPAIVMAVLAGGACFPVLVIGCIWVGAPPGREAVSLVVDMFVDNAVGAYVLQYIGTGLRSTGPSLTVLPKHLRLMLKAELEV